MDFFELFQSGALLLALLNPFLMIIYLLDPVQKLEWKRFRNVMIRAGLIAGVVFSCFALLGDAVFSEVLQVEFASFQIFGGIIFLMIGIHFVFRGPSAIEILRGESENLVGSIAMPVLIGPGTIGASVIIGERHDPLTACTVTIAAVVMSIVIMLILKLIYDFMRPRRERLVQRYFEITGRITALYVGTVSVNMIMLGLRTWIDKFVEF